LSISSPSLDRTQPGWRRISLVLGFQITNLLTHTMLAHTLGMQDLLLSEELPEEGGDQ
jgi:hypothetical protein